MGPVAAAPPAPPMMVPCAAVAPTAKAPGVMCPVAAAPPTDPAVPPTATASAIQQRDSNEHPLENIEVLNGKIILLNGKIAIYSGLAH